MTDDIDATPQPFGPVEITYTIDAATYREVRRAYKTAVADGYTDTFVMFVTNNCSVSEEVVTIAVEPDADLKVVRV